MESKRNEEGGLVKGSDRNSLRNSRNTEMEVKLGAVGWERHKMKRRVKGDGERKRKKKGEGRGAGGGWTGQGKWGRRRDRAATALGILGSSKPGQCWE